MSPIPTNVLKMCMCPVNRVSIAMRPCGHRAWHHIYPHSSALHLQRKVPPVLCSVGTLFLVGSLHKQCPGRTRQTPFGTAMSLLAQFRYLTEYIRGYLLKRWPRTGRPRMWDARTRRRDLVQILPLSLSQLACGGACWS